MVGLNDISGLANISFVDDLQIIETDIENLNDLSQIGGDVTSITLGGNDLLTDISGLSNITSVSDNLAIANLSIEAN